MFRLMIGMGSVLLEVASIATEGMLAASMLVSGTIITLVHLVADSCSFSAVVNRLTGCDLPERLPAAAPVESSSIAPRLGR